MPQEDLAKMVKFYEDFQQVVTESLQNAKKRKDEGDALSQDQQNESNSILTKWDFILDKSKNTFCIKRRDEDPNDES